MLAETLEVMLPSVFDDAVPPANQFHDTKFSLPLLCAVFVPTVNPFESNDFKPSAIVLSAFDVLLFKSFVAPLV